MHAAANRGAFEVGLAQSIYIEPAKALPRQKQASFGRNCMHKYFVDINSTSLTLSCR